MSGEHHAIEALSSEERVFPPSEEFVAQANATSEIYEQEDWVSFWRAQALERVSWFT